MNRSLLPLAFLSMVLACAPVFGDDATPPKNWNRPSQSLTGPTGYISLPSSETVDYENLSLGVHRFGVGLLYSWPRNVEYGFSFDLPDVTTSSLNQTTQAFSPEAKIRLLDSATWGHVAGGFYRKTYYGVYEHNLFTPSVIVEGGGSVTNFQGMNTGKGFSALVYQTSLSRYMLEVDGRNGEPSIGWRYMLASWIAMDTSLSNLWEYDDKLHNFSFGVTILSK